MHRSRLLIATASFAFLALWSCARPVGAVTIGSPQRVGTITSSTLDEVSGLVASRSLADVLWVHNDSGDFARFFAISRQGSLLGTFPLTGASEVDWEDIAIGPNPAGGNYLFLCDIGDNDAKRASITVHRTNEPLNSSGGTIASSDYRSLRLQYPNGARDAESMFVDPLSGDLFIITKRLLVPELYSVSASAFETTSQPATMTRLGSFSELPFWATAADISPDGRFILVRSGISSTGRIFERSPGQSIAEAFASPGVPFALGSEAQGEAIGWAADGAQFFTTSEFNGGSSAPIHSYAFAAPPLVTLPGDYNDDHVVDAADYSVWRNQLGAGISLPNEVETPGVVSNEDYAVWKTHFGESLDGGGAGKIQGETAPEPASWLVACWGIAGVAERRRNRRRSS